MPLRLDLRGVKEIRAALAEVIGRFFDMTDLWLDYAEILSRFEAEWFQTEGRGAWPPLAPETLLWKARHGYPPDPLIRTGNLLESLTDPGQAAQVGQGRTSLGTFSRQAFSWGTDVVDERGREYAHYHQYGEGSNPLRQVIPWPLPADVDAELEAANQRFAERVIRESGL
jgi:hypothetical protein